jgi:hypothetical protein
MAEHTTRIARTLERRALERHDSSTNALVSRYRRLRRG